MKKFLNLILCVFLSTGIALPMGKPSWIKKLPKPTNSTYYFRVTKADGKNYEEAYKKAFSMSILESSWKRGLEVTPDADSKTIEETINSNLNLKGIPENIAINKVCEYDEFSPNGGIMLYILWQVAETGIRIPKFDDFTECE